MLLPMQIRPATPSDTNQICGIWNPIIRETLVTFTTVEKTPADIELMLSKPHPFFVAVEGTVVLGFTTYGPFRAGPGYAETMELSINLAPQARGKGVGTQLLQALETAAKTNGIFALIAGVSGANPNAIRFHETNAYTRVGTLSQVGLKMGQRLDLVLLQKLL
jgi:phosphinothricin acetyltransferase